jgi:PRTRC genetic system protein A
MLNAIDTAMQAVTPTVMVPRHEAFEPMTNNGHRFLAAADGLWLEARRPWLYVRWQLAKQESVPMPYGSVTAAMSIETAPRKLVEEFVAEAKRQCPLECAAWIVWNEVTGEWKLIHLPPTLAKHDEVTFDRPRLSEDEHLVFDLHSHGRIPAFFSSKDNKDDRGEFKVSGVFGNLHGDVQAEFRLCANGKFIDLGYKWESQ